MSTAELRDEVTQGEVTGQVVVTVDWLGPFSSIVDGALPKIAPTLPDGVDCLWMVTLKSAPIRAIYWLGDGVWRDTVLLQEHLAVRAE